MSAITAKQPRLHKNPLWGDVRQFSPVTYAPEGMFERREDDPVKLRWYATNCDKLATFMASLQPGRHDQGTWVSQSSSRAAANECGTAACALGWAAFSQIIPGLQYTFAPYNKKSLLPTVDGEQVYWGCGKKFFGEDVQLGIFNDGYLTKEQVIKKLRAQAKEYREQAAREES